MDTCPHSAVCCFAHPDNGSPANGSGGVAWDRTWLVTREDGRFLTQRQLPKCGAPWMQS